MTYEIINTLLFMLILVLSVGSALVFLAGALPKLRIQRLFDARSILLKRALKFGRQAWALRDLLFGDGRPREVATKKLPKIAGRLLSLLLSEQDRENVMGDLQEAYHELIAKSGRLKARLWIYNQVITSAWPLVRKAISRRFSSERVK